MQLFRRFILKVISVLEMLFVVGMTFGCGVLGAIVPGVLAGEKWALYGFLAAGLVGFCISAIIVNISMCLAEVAANTYYIRHKVIA
jgi:hypothetical protein